MLKTYAITDIGLRRQLNQDFVFSSEEPVGSLPNLFIVADGMGGHKAGDFASRYAVETIIEEIKATDEKEPVAILNKAISKANTYTILKSLQDDKLSGMGTTVVMATCIGNELEVANVGDSRLYLINDKIEQITIDHSLVEEMVRMGSISREAARNHPDKNIITRAIGAQDTVEADIFTLEVRVGDMILLCSDGLTNMIEDEDILKILKSGESLKDMAEELVRTANNNGGKDNISLIIIERAADEVEHD
ncbi:MAG: Stp1/IreP family PP2C-type Ser/Thr phosphatase [Butyrivibrio sp.]|nr:Stp1/IreP family PP2C-type Ser/Thr phosphatase [Butyrivibrio sp.]